MKRVLLSITVLLFFVGCGNSTSEAKKEKNNSKEEVSELSLQQYYNVALETIESTATGTISGNGASGVLQGGANVFEYNGEINKGILTASGMSNNNPISVDSDLESLGDDLENNYIIAYLIYDLSLDDCRVDNRTIKCLNESIQENEINEGLGFVPTNLKYDGQRLEYILKFSKSNELESIYIKSAQASLFNQTEKSQYDVVDQMTKYFDEPDYKFFSEIPFSGQIFYSEATIKY